MKKHLTLLLIIGLAPVFAEQSKFELEGVYTRMDDSIELKANGLCIWETFDTKGKAIRDKCKWRMSDEKVIVQIKKRSETFPVRTTTHAGKKRLVLTTAEVAGEPVGYSRELPN